MRFLLITPTSTCAWRKYYASSIHVLHTRYLLCAWIGLGEWWCSLLPIDSDSDSDSDTTIVYHLGILLFSSCFLISSDVLVCVICVRIIPCIMSIRNARGADGCDNHNAIDGEIRSICDRFVLGKVHGMFLCFRFDETIGVLFLRLPFFMIMGCAAVCDAGSRVQGVVPGSRKRSCMLRFTNYDTLGFLPACKLPKYVE